MSYSMNEKNGDKLGKSIANIHPELSSIYGKDVADLYATAGTYSLIKNSDLYNLENWRISPQNSAKIQFDSEENFAPESNSPKYKKAIHFTVTQDIQSEEVISIIENTGEYTISKTWTLSHWLIFPIIYNPNSYTIPFRMEIALTKGYGRLISSDLNASRGTFPMIYQSTWANHATATMKPQIRLSIKGPVSSGTKFDLLGVYSLGYANTFPDITDINKIIKGWN